MMRTFENVYLKLFFIFEIWTVRWNERLWQIWTTLDQRNVHFFGRSEDLRSPHGDLRLLRTRMDIRPQWNPTRRSDMDLKTILY